MSRPMLRHWAGLEARLNRLLVVDFLGPELIIFKYEGGAGDTPPV